MRRILMEKWLIFRKVVVRWSKANFKRQPVICNSFAHPMWWLLKRPINDYLQSEGNRPKFIVRKEASSKGAWKVKTTILGEVFKGGRFTTPWTHGHPWAWLLFTFIRTNHVHQNRSLFPKEQWVFWMKNGSRSKKKLYKKKIHWANSIIKV